MFSFILNTAKYSFHENKQIESSRFKGVSCSVLVVEYGHLAVTKRKASEEWLHAFSIFKPIEKMEVVLNENYLAGNDSAGNGLFTLYSTKHMFTFILLDQHDGRMWQVQWAIDADQRLVIPINPTQNSTNL